MVLFLLFFSYITETIVIKKHSYYFRYSFFSSHQIFFFFDIRLSLCAQKIKVQFKKEKEKVGGLWVVYGAPKHSLNPFFLSLFFFFLSFDKSF